MIKKLLLTFIVLLAVYQLKSQYYNPGQIVTFQNDTIQGFIKIKGERANSMHCVFKKDMLSDPIKYNAGQIKTYTIFGEREFFSYKLFNQGNIEDVFIEVLIKGNVSLYHTSKLKNMAFFIQKGDSSLIGLKSEQITFTANPMEGNPVYNREYYYNTRVFQDTLKSVFYDSKIILDQLYNLDYNKKQLINIIKSYIKETCQKEPCIKFEKNLLLEKDFFGLYSGVFIYKLDFQLKDQTTDNYKSKFLATIPVGVFYNIPLRYLSYNLSFQPEVLFTKVDFKSTDLKSNTDDFDFDVSYQTVHFPLLFKYHFKGDTFKPNIGVGKAFAFVINSKVSPKGNIVHSTQKGEWILQGGCDYKLNQRIRFFTNIRYQNSKNLIIPEHSKKILYNKLIEDEDYVAKVTTNAIMVTAGISF